MSVDYRLLNTWQSELQAKPWLRLALGGIAVLLAVLGLLELDDWVQGAGQDHQRLQREIARMQAIAGEPEWRRQRDEVFARLATLRERSWREESEGRMQALMQDWMLERLGAHGLTPGDLAATVLPTAAPRGPDAKPGAPNDSDLRLVRIKATFNFDPDRLHALLADLAAQPRAVQVVRMSVLNGARRSAELELEAVFVLATRGNS